VRPRRQQGIALLALIAILVVAVSGAVISAFSLTRLRLERAALSTAALAEVSEALIGWSVSHPDHPGMLPYPDRGADGNYDGNSDCVSAMPTNAQLLGKVPWLGQTNPCVTPRTGLGVSVFDGHGETPWMAVSRNLMVVPPITFPPISLALRDNPPPVPWMSVVDATGSVISSRVAAVVLAPGALVTGKIRAGAAAPDNFLDRLLAGATSVDNADNSDLTFVVAAPTDTYNDRLRFITIDQWVAAALPRVVGEVRASLERYRAGSGFYPPFAAPAVDGVCASGTSSGYLPLTDGDCGSSLSGDLPAGLLGAWFSGWAVGIGYTRDAPLQATITLDGVPYVITP
jgi:hypothetical protein